jgi:hypothetical protein
VKCRADFRSVLAHVRSPLQVVDQIDREPRISIAKVTSATLAVQTMSCAPLGPRLDPNLPPRTDLN